MKVSGIKQGVPSWVELATSDEDGALAFYSALFGWEDDAQHLPPEAGGGAYHMQRIGGDNVAAISKQQPDEAQAGIPPHWNVYLAVDDVDAVTGKVQGAGGAVVVPPMDVMEAGRMAFVADPTGGMVGLWQAGQHAGFQRVQEPGAFTWAELATDQPDAAAKFFASVLDVPTEALPVPEGSDPYTIVGPAQEQRAGIAKKTAATAGMPNTWNMYLEVDDPDATATRAKELGGTVLVEPFDVPVAGRIAVLADPQGAVFGVIKSAPPPQS